MLNWWSWGTQHATMPAPQPSRVNFNQRILASLSGVPLYGKVLLECWAKIHVLYVASRNAPPDHETCISISKRRTLLSSATAADEGGSHPSHRLVMIGYGQRASARFCAITYDGYRPVIRGLVVVRDHSLSKPFHNAVSVLTKKSVRSHAQGFFSVGGWTNTLTTT